MSAVNGYQPDLTEPTAEEFQKQKQQQPTHREEPFSDVGTSAFLSEWMRNCCAAFDSEVAWKQTRLLPGQTIRIQPRRFSGLLLLLYHLQWKNSGDFYPVVEVTSSNEALHISVTAPSGGSRPAPVLPEGILDWLRQHFSDMQGTLTVSQRPGGYTLLLSMPVSRSSSAFLSASDLYFLKSLSSQMQQSAQDLLRGKISPHQVRLP